jgi:hypothetical protein
MKDNFSAQADIDAGFRPGYPSELYNFVLSLAKSRHAAWDCGTGNGQVAAALSEYFDKYMKRTSVKTSLYTLSKNTIYFMQ